MKHNPKITIILLAMFVITQFIGLYVMNVDVFHKTVEIEGEQQNITNPILSFLQPPEIQQESDFSTYFGSMIFAFIIAIVLLFLLIKFKIDFVLKIWFFSVIVIALFITTNAFFSNYLHFSYFWVPALILSLALAFLKVFKQNFIIHNLTELLIYPGIATIFVSILSFWSMMILLILISAYDIWAVWHSGIMQKMAKYQINKLKLFSGFFVPYVSKKLRLKLKLMKKSKLKNKKIKVNLAILGGGDVTFPIITMGVVLMTQSVNLPFGLKPFIGGIFPALSVIFGATLGLALLFIFSEKKKFYPAMPFISAGIFFGLILSYLFL
jgi:presenilin-like A22 family membrane protease